MPKGYRTYLPEQDLLVPPSLRQWLPESHLVYFVSDVVDQLDLSAIHAVYEQEKRGQPPYDPRLMRKLLVYGYCTGGVLFAPDSEAAAGRHPVQSAGSGQTSRTSGSFLIFARSTKRIERSFLTAQDRLVKHLRLAKVSTLEGANAFLEKEYWPEWNAYFARPVADFPNQHRALTPQLVTEINKCLELDPNLWVAYFIQGQAFEQLGRFPEALAALKKSQEILGDNPSRPSRRKPVCTPFPTAAALPSRRLIGYSPYPNEPKSPSTTLPLSMHPWARRIKPSPTSTKPMTSTPFCRASLRLTRLWPPLRSDFRFQDLLRRMKFQ